MGRLNMIIKVRHPGRDESGWRRWERTLEDEEVVLPRQRKNGLSALARGRHPGGVAAVLRKSMLHEGGVHYTTDGLLVPEPCRALLVLA